MKNHISALVVLLTIFLAACNLTWWPTEVVVTPTPIVQAPIPIVYYYFVPKPPPAGSIVILADILILGPTNANVAHGPDTAANLGAALKAMIADSHNAWTGTNVTASSVSFSNGAANVALQGKISAAGDVVLIATRMQILLTVFAETAVKTAVVTLNGENIANMGISNSGEAKPANYAYTRAEIETFMAANAYKAP
jgi:hypothetical protein